MSVTVTMRAARSQDMQACAAIYNDWLDSTSWMPRIHAREEVLHHYETEVLSRRETLVAVDGARVRGFVTFSKDGFVTALYVEKESRNLGVGGMLLEKAKRQLHPRANLYVFEANQGATAFYKRHGFVEINRTNGDNDEGLPDILLEWHA